MTCKELIEFLYRYVDGELPDAQRAEFDRHMAMCGPCKRYLETYRETIRLSRAAMCCGEEAPKMPEEMVQAILRARAAGG